MFLDLLPQFNEKLIMMNFNEIFKIIDWFVWSICLTVFTVTVIASYCGNVEFYRPIMEYAGLTWLLIWPIFYGICRLVIKTMKDIKNIKK